MNVQCCSTWFGTPLKTIRQVSWFRGRMHGFSLHCISKTLLPSYVLSSSKTCLPCSRRMSKTPLSASALTSAFKGEHAIEKV